MNEHVRAAFDGDADPAETLTAFATNLLRLLLGERSLAVNPGPRSASSAVPPNWPGCCWPRGRHRTGPIVEAYLARLAGQGRLAVDDGPRRSDCWTGW